MLPCKQIGILGKCCGLLKFISMKFRTSGCYCWQGLSLPYYRRSRFLILLRTYFKIWVHISLVTIWVTVISEGHGFIFTVFQSIMYEWFVHSAPLLPQVKPQRILESLSPQMLSSLSSIYHKFTTTQCRGKAYKQNNCPWVKTL